jgi:hypothetical protein
VEVGRGASDELDGGEEGQHEVSPHLVLTKTLVSYSKIVEFRSNLRMLSTMMSPTCGAKQIYTKVCFG